MSAGVCYIRADLSGARAVNESPAWRARRADANEPETLDELRARVEECAAWAGANAAQGRRISWACVDVEGMLCAWIRAQSLAPPVLMAAWRGLVQDWGDRLSTGAVEALVDDVPTARAGLLKPRKPAGSSQAGATRPREHFAVLALHDALPRLWLNALDHKGVRVERVLSLWHALARAWAPADDQLSAVVMIDPEGRLVWCWSRGAALECGGSVRIELETAEPAPSHNDFEHAHDRGDPLSRAAARLVLDWASWGCHLGSMPSRVRVIGADPSLARVAFILRERLAESTIETQGANDPLGATLGALAKHRAADAPPGARGCMVGATRRPTRAVRARYAWGAAAAAVAALALAVAGVRLNSTAKGAVRQADELLSTASADAVKAYPTVEGLSVRDALSDRLARERLEKPPELPPVPRPILSELTQMTGVLSKYPGVRITSMELDQLQPGELIIAIPERRVGETIGAELQLLANQVEWQPRARQQGGDQLILEGKWR